MVIEIGENFNQCNDTVMINIEVRQYELSNFEGGYSL